MWLRSPLSHTAYPITGPRPYHYSSFFLSSQEGNPMTALTARLRCHPGCSQLSSWKGRSEVPWTYDHNSCHGKRPWVAFQASSHGSSASAAQEKCPTLPLPSNPLSLSLPSFSTFYIYIYLLSVHTIPFPSQIPISNCNRMD